jgi:hypothetical protein
MRTERVILQIGRADGRVADVPMRFNLSHQHAYRCYFGALADPAAEIKEATPPSFVGENLFEALVGWRATIEPEGWRLLHAVARADCWPRPSRATPFVEQLTCGEETTCRVNGLDPAPFDAVATLAEQQANFKTWMASLPPVALGRAPPRAGHGKDRPEVAFGPLAKLAGRMLRSGEADGDAGR